MFVDLKGKRQLSRPKLMQLLFPISHSIDRNISCCDQAILLSMSTKAKNGWLDLQWFEAIWLKLIELLCKGASVC